jgi:hypothetical protein
MRVAICGVLATLQNTAEVMGDSTCEHRLSQLHWLKLNVPSYALDIIIPTNTSNATIAPAGCNVTTGTDPYIINGGFEDGLANWTAVAYNSSSATFEIGVTNDSLEGCTALSVSHIAVQS